MRFKNFQIWRGRLPHWRADDVVYYVTFRHRRDLTYEEREILYRLLLKPEGKQWSLEVLCILPAETSLMFSVSIAPTGRPYELSELIEKAKAKAGRQIIKRTSERFPPFYAESFDRIVRDEPEFEERFLGLIEAPMAAELVEDSSEYAHLYVREDAGSSLSTERRV